MTQNGEGQSGPDLIRALARTLPDAPGVYRMIGEKGEVLYVGKARSLKKRVMSYTRDDRLPVRLQKMVEATHDMVFVRTHTESEALLLEANLIKKMKPRYNVLLRDDKSFPYLLITGDHDFPLLTKHRGARTREGRYFGPFAGAGDVNETAAALQKAFMIRNCSDSFFAQRKRPCLQYHIKRCTAPCVGMVGAEDYARQVKDAVDFLSGKSRAVQDRLAVAMKDASEREDYETAALLRDRIRALTAVQARQDINLEGAVGDVDVIAMHRESARSCVQVFFIRGGRNFGNRAFFPSHGAEDTDEDILSAFIAQFYESKTAPPDVVLSHDLSDAALMGEALKTDIATPQRGAKKRLIDFAADNARAALALEGARRAGEEALLEKLADLFDLDGPPQRIEIYDNSHTGGTNMIGAMVVAGADGFRKAAYRKFNIREAGASDDYGMMREVMKRRFREGLPDTDAPDLLLIDGGQGQLNAVREALDDVGVAVPVVSIAKGPDRNAGRETFYMADRTPFTLPPDDPVMHYLQRLRDEAHRFAIGAHRARRSAALASSPLDEIPGIGAKRKKALLTHFGSAQDVARAGLKDLEKVEGISAATARAIYDHFHGD